MDLFVAILDKLYYGFIEPLSALLIKGLVSVLITPLTAIGIPVFVHIILLAMLTAFFSLWLRTKLQVEDRVATFNQSFAAKREQQKNLQFIPDKYARSALYDASDDDLNHDYNTFLAHHYSRYVFIYLLPIFLIMALLNSFFSESYILERTGMPYVLPLPENSYGMQGISVTALFLLSYVITLIAGFQFRKYLHD